MRKAYDASRTTFLVESNSVFHGLPRVFYPRLRIENTDLVVHSALVTISADSFSRNVMTFVKLYKFLFLERFCGI